MKLICIINNIKTLAYNNIIYWLSIKQERNTLVDIPLVVSVIRMGLEPMTPTLKVLCSTSWASGSPYAFSKSECKGSEIFWYYQIIYNFSCISCFKTDKQEMTLSNLFSGDYVSIARFKMSCKHSSVKIYFKYYCSIKLK